MMPARAIVAALISGGIGITPAGTSSDVWPIYYASMPDGANVPDACIGVYDTAGKKQSRVMRGGQTIEHPGIQVKVRASSPQVARTKIEAIANFLDSVNRLTVTVDTENATIQAISRGVIISMGKVPGNRPRDAYSVNATLSFV